MLLQLHFWYRIVVKIYLAWLEENIIRYKIKYDRNCYWIDYFYYVCYFCYFHGDSYGIRRKIVKSCTWIISRAYVRRWWLVGSISSWRWIKKYGKDVWRNYGRSQIFKNLPNRQGVEKECFLKDIIRIIINRKIYGFPKNIGYSQRE